MQYSAVHAVKYKKKKRTVQWQCSLLKYSAFKYINAVQCSMAKYSAVGCSALRCNVCGEYPDSSCQVVIINLKPQSPGSGVNTGPCLEHVARSYIFQSNFLFFKILLYGPVMNLKI